MQQGTRSGFEISDSRLDSSRLRQDIRQSYSAAMITLEVAVTPEMNGKALERLDSEIYAPLAQAEGLRIVQESLSRFGILDAYVVQRAGRLTINEPVFWIGVTAQREEAAHQATQFILQQLNLRLPVWYKALYKDGSSDWLESKTLPIDSKPLPTPPPEVIAPVMAPVAIERPKTLVEHATVLEEAARQPETPVVSPSDALGLIRFSDTPTPKAEPELEPILPQSLTPQAYYETQLNLSGFGVDGQQNLANAKVLVIGAGSLGNAVLQYLAGAGIGQLGICDHAKLEAGHLHSQPLFSANDIHKNKAILAAERLQNLNPFIHLQVHPKKLERHNIKALLEAYDVIVDCSDNIKTRLLINEAAVVLKKPLVQASVYQYEGQIHFYHPEVGGCLRCQWPNLNADIQPEPKETLGAVPGLFGVLQAMEVIKALVGLPTPLTENLLIFDLLTYQPRLIQRQINPYCPVCQTYGPAARSLNSQTVTPIENDLTHEADTDADWAVMIDPAQNEQLSNYMLVDVSEAREHAQFPGHPCLNMPFSRFDLKSPRLDREHQYLFYCQKGTRSAHLVKELRKRGYYNMFALAGGYGRLQKLYNFQLEMSNLELDLVTI